MNIVYNTKLNLLSEKESVIHIFLSYKDSMTSKIFPEDEPLSNP
jgi:hypothetical protein